LGQDLRAGPVKKILLRPRRESGYGFFPIPSHLRIFAIKLPMGQLYAVFTSLIYGPPELRDLQRRWIRARRGGAEPAVLCGHHRLHTVAHGCARPRVHELSMSQRLRSRQSALSR
jgi:hypothetical protein